MDREAWRAAIHGVAKCRTRLSDWTELNLPYYLRKFKGLMVKLKSSRKEVQVSQPDVLLALRLFWYTHVLCLWCKIASSPQCNQILTSSSKSTPSGPRFYKRFSFFSAMLCGMGSTRNQTSMPALETQSLNNWTIKEVSRSLHFESILMRWMKLGPIIQSEVSQKEKHQYSILTHIYGI